MYLFIIPVTHDRAFCITMDRTTYFRYQTCEDRSYTGYHSFSTSAKFSEKLTYLTPNTHTYVCVSRRKKSWFIGNFVNVLKERSPVTSHFNPFQANVPFLYPLRISKNRRFSGVFRKYDIIMNIGQWVEKVFRPNKLERIECENYSKSTVQTPCVREQMFAEKSLGFTTEV